MKNLHKKISIVVLSGALFIGGVFSLGDVAYASSNRLLRDFEIEHPIYVSNANKENSDWAVKQGAKLYGYKVYISDIDSYKVGDVAYYRNDVVDKNSEEMLELLLYLYPWLQFSSNYFKSGLDFQKYLNKYGMKKGFHNVWIGGRRYILLFPYNLNV